MSGHSSVKAPVQSAVTSQPSAYQPLYAAAQAGVLEEVLHEDLSCSEHAVFSGFTPTQILLEILNTFRQPGDSSAAELVEGFGGKSPAC